jgi:phenylacetic acid degradation operon negative regulatory protein
MIKKTRNNRKEIILKVLLGVGFLTTAIVAPNAVQLYKYFIPKNNRDRWEIKKSLTRLEKTGFVKKRITNGEEYYSLTLLGSKRAKRYELDSIKIKKQEKWDGLWRLVMFDVPEKKMMARRGINLVLKKLGCVQYQKSVFITPFPCEKEIDFVGECFESREYIRVITARDVEGIEQIKKVFKV